MAAPAVDPLFYSTTEAATKLACSSEHVRHLIDRGELSGQRLGRKIVVSVAEVHRLAGSRAPHEALLSRHDQGDTLRELRKVHAEIERLHAEEARLLAQMEV